MKLTMRIEYTPRDLRQRLEAGQGVINEELVGSLTTMREKVTAVATKFAPVDRRGLRTSLQPGRTDTYTTTDVARKRALVGSKLPYAAVHEFGRDDGWWPPRQPIRDWVYRNRRKFGVGGGKAGQREVDRIAYLVRRKIARRGIKGKHYLQRALESIFPAFARRALQQAAEAILKRLGLK